MKVDEPTLLLVSIFVTLIVASLLLLSWRQSRMSALGWWGAGNLLAAAAATVPLLSERLVSGAFADVASSTIFLAYGLFWAGIRAFEGRSTTLGWAAVGAVTWLVAAYLPVFRDDPVARQVLSSMILGVYTAASAFALMGERSEGLVSRNAAVFFLALHAVIFACRIPVALAHGLGSEADLRNHFFAAFALENLLFTVAMAFILLAMVKERLELAQRRQALTDPLTGLPNRRAFFERGGAMLQSGARGARDCAIVLFDLDGFKQVNDTRGHNAGDQALKSFSRVASAQIPADALFARIGGEEFALLASGMSGEEAVQVAERVRTASEACRIETDEGSFSVTVSGGVASRPPASTTLDRLLAEADQALYAAKRLGRNRNELALPGPDAASQPERVPARRPGSVVRAFRSSAG
jgi:diguanylate cyclase (GGDEF)-like protein